MTTGNSNIIIAVVDGFPDTNHEAITGKFAVPMNDDLVFTSDRSISSHATNICSTIAAESDRVTGVAPGIRLLPLVVNLYSQSYAERADAILLAADLAREKKIGNQNFSRLIMSCSWKTSGDISVIRTALEEAVEANVLVVCSAGNDNTNAPHYPSDYSNRDGALKDGLLSVAATDQNDVKAAYSNFSPNIDVSAPGGDGLPMDAGDLLCADQGNDYIYTAGTSFSAPQVAGVAALMLSLDPNLAPSELKRIIKENCDDIKAKNRGFATTLGNGRINALKSLGAVAASLPVQPEPPETPTGGTSPEDIKVCVYDAAPDAQVTQGLLQYARTLQQDTGWVLAVVQIEKDNARSVIFLK